MSKPQEAISTNRGNFAPESDEKQGRMDRLSAEENPKNREL
jgi:hypothetical protein